MVYVMYFGMSMFPVFCIKIEDHYYFLKRIDMRGIIVYNYSRYTIVGGF